MTTQLDEDQPLHRLEQGAIMRQLSPLLELGLRVQDWDDGPDTVLFKCPFKKHATEGVQLRLSSGYWRCTGCGEQGDFEQLLRFAEYYAWGWPEEFREEEGLRRQLRQDRADAPPA